VRRFCFHHLEKTHTFRASSGIFNHEDAFSFTKTCQGGKNGMEESVMNALLQQGPFAALFVWLLFSTKKEGRDR